MVMQRLPTAEGPAPLSSLPVHVHYEEERAETPGERWQGEKGIHRGELKEKAGN